MHLLIQASKRSSGGSEDVDSAGYEAAQRAEKCTIWSYRLGALVLFVLAVLIIAGIVFVIADAIDSIHTARPFTV